MSAGKEFDRRRFLALGLAAALPIHPSLAQKNPMNQKSPPVAPVHPHSYTAHGVTLEDPYAWLRDKDYPKVDDPEILDYLNAENAWFEAHMQPHAELVDQLFGELKGRIKEDDSSVPYPDGDWLYWWQFAPGAQYRDWYRRPPAGGDAQLILSEPTLAAGKQYFRLGVFTISPDGKLLAYSQDTSGEERFELIIRDLATGNDLVTIAPDTLGAIAWAADSRSLLWVQASAEWRPVKAFHHRLGTPPGNDPLIYHEQDPVWRIGVGKTQDRRWIIVAASESESSEIRLIDARDPGGPQILVRPRQKGVRYSIDASGDTLYVLTNDEHINFRIATAPITQPDVWTTLIPGSDDHYLTGLTAFTSFLAIEERLRGLDQIRLRFPSGEDRRVAFPEASYAASLGTNAEPDAPELRIGYTSMITPRTVYDYRVVTDALITRKVQEIPSGYDASQYVTERLFAPARDGTLIPISVVYKKGYRKDGSQPLHCYGYGAYGIAISPGFSGSRLSLLDRGFAWAILHIRGGDDLGYQWYLDGKMAKRNNAFNDFLDATHYLNAQGFGAPGRTSASGGSAGGWLMGVVTNREPEQWRAIVAHVPFVDVLNTMLDDTLPLTPGEYPEWGNPAADPETFARLLELSPYEQVRVQDYPAILVTAGLADPRVTYWEPAKWVARLRTRKTDDNPLLLKTNMGAGHGGKSGRFESLRETAEEYAFLITMFDREQAA